MNEKPLITRDLKYLLNTKASRTIYPARKGSGKHRVLAASIFVGMVWLGVNSVASIPPISQWAAQTDPIPPTKRHLVTYFHKNITSIVQEHERSPNSSQDLIEEPSAPGGHKEGNKQEWKSHTIRRGDTLEKIFRRWGVQHKDAVVIANLKDAKAHLQLKPGRTLRMQSTGGDKLQELRYEIGLEQTLAVSRHGDQFIPASAEYQGQESGF